MRDLLPCPPCGRQGRPGQGFLAGSNTSEPRGSAPRERDHRGGDHPVPSRTRQLSPPSPRVLQRKAAGGQGVALAEGAFLSAPREARGGMLPPVFRQDYVSVKSKTSFTKRSATFQNTAKVPAEAPSPASSRRASARASSCSSPFRTSPASHGGLSGPSWPSPYRRR